MSIVINKYFDSTLINQIIPDGILGAGLEEFKKYYGKREHYSIIDEKNVEEEKKMLYNMFCRGTSYLDVEIVLGEFYKIEDLQNVIKEEEAYDTK